MKRLKKIIAVLAMCTISVSVMGCKMIEKTPEAIKNTVVAKVGNEKITKGDIDKEMKMYTDQLKQQYGDNYENNEQISSQLKQLKQQTLDSLISEKIMLQKATELNLKPSDDDINKEVDDKINQYKTQYSGEGEYDNFLKQNGFTEDQLKTFLTNQAIVKPVINDIVKDATVTDDDIQKYYDENKDSQFTKQGEIDYNKSLETAKQLKSQLGSGTDFAELAKEKSDDPGTKDNGGSLGFIEYGSTKYVKEFMDGFKNLKEGEISEPIKSDFGYHIIKVTGVTDKGADVSHILVANRGESVVTSLDDVKEDIRGQLEQQKKNSAFTNKIGEWKKELNVKTYEDRL